MQPDIFTLDETAKAADVSYGRLQYHIRFGNIPKPEIFHNRKMYSTEAVERIRQFFASRTLWERVVDREKPEPRGFDNEENKKGEEVRS